MARPTKLTEEVIAKAKYYLENYKTEYKHTIPSVVGLCKVLKIAKSTIYEWAKKEDSEFSDIVETINDYQHFDLVEGGLTNELNPTITKLLLHKHGHSDKQEVDNSVSINSIEIPVFTNADNG